MLISDLKAAFQDLGQVGYAEATVEIGAHRVRVRTLSAHETSQVQQTAVEADGVNTRLEHYVHVVKIESVARAITRLGDIVLPDYVEVSGETREKHMVLREVVRQWGEHVLTAIFRAYQDLEERTEIKVRQAVRYEPPDYQSGIDWHRKQIENLEKRREERERWLALAASKAPEGAPAEAEPEPADAHLPPRPAQPPAPTAAPPQVSAGAAPAPAQPVAGRYRVDTAPPPHAAQRAADSPGIQLDDATFLDPDPDAIRTSMAREEERIRLERVRRAQTAALIATEAASRPADPVQLDHPLQRRAEAIRQAGVVPPPMDDPNELRRPAIPPGGPGRIELNPAAGELARNPRFVRRQ